MNKFQHTVVSQSFGIFNRSTIFVSPSVSGEKGTRGEKGEPGIGERGEHGPPGPIGNNQSLTVFIIIGLASPSP